MKRSAGLGPRPADPTTGGPGPADHEESPTRMEHRVSEELFDEMIAGLPGGSTVAEAMNHEPVNVTADATAAGGRVPDAREDLRVGLARLAALRAAGRRAAELARAERDVSAIPVTVEVDLRRRRPTS